MKKLSLILTCLLLVAPSLLGASLRTSNETLPEGTVIDTYTSTRNPAHSIDIGTGIAGIRWNECINASKQSEYVIRYYGFFNKVSYVYKGRVVTTDQLDDLVEQEFQKKEQREQEVQSQQDQENKLFLWGCLIFLFVSMVGVTGIVKGVKQRVVFYYNTTDLMICLALPIVLLILFVIAFAALPKPPTQNPSLNVVISWGVISFPYAVFIGYNFYKAFKYNSTSKWDAITVAVGRTLFTVVAIFVAWGSAGTGQKDSESNEAYASRKLADMISFAAVMAGLAWVCKRLINGERIKFGYEDQ